MSGMKTCALTQFYKHLHARGERVATLADAIGTGRAHLTQVINGTRGLLRAGKPTGTYRRLWKLLTPSERLALNRHWATVPRETKFHAGCRS